MWRLMYDRSSTTLRMQTSPGNYTNTTWPECWWRPGPSSEAAPSQGAYTRSDRTWLMPKETNANIPDIGDLITNSVTDIDPVVFTWTVIGISDVGALGAWAVDSISLELQSGLTGTANVTRPTNAQDAAGRQLLSNYTAVATNVPAKLQLMDSNSEDALGRRTMPKEYVIYMSTFVDVRALDLINTGGGNYTVLTSRNQNRIDQLQEISVEAIL